ncbi:hypothetical protein C2845_PM15G07710 [Panicum miliaceum]|uniref:Uncharacterized protein n=1 Tax=Panicum miliaceum TaxID=4540 RepID=A0A3L6Q6R2_PANMI|nr:hypothetical protein C2845_PM15G07710 [Panicum miliaceum]
MTADSMDASPADSLDAAPADSMSAATGLRVGQHRVHILEVDGAATGLRVGQHGEHILEVDGAATGIRVGQHREQPPDSASSKEMAPDSSEQVASPDSEMTPLDFVPDSLLPESQPSLCVRCGATHAGNEYSEACHAACREARKCARCGLIHSEYDLGTRMIPDLNKFDCQFFIPHV